MDGKTDWQKGYDAHNEGKDFDPEQSDAWKKGWERAEDEVLEDGVEIEEDEEIEGLDEESE